jgi:DNA-binding transcriptional ArsR family regulator
MARSSPSLATGVAASTMATCSRALKLLADETRLAVIEQLLSGPRHVHEINSELCVDPTLLSHHLRVLREAGLVATEREGKSILYRLASEVRLAQRGRAIDFGCCRLSFSRGPANPVTKK